MRFCNWLGKIFLGYTVACFVIGILGICDGIRSVINGGYADNIVLGLIVATAFPLVGLMGCSVAKALEQDEKRRAK